jgi:hypothetical protein
VGHQAIGEQTLLWLEPAGRSFRRALDRSTRLRLILLGIAGFSGTLLLLSPALILVTAIGSAVYFFNHIQGPLDWFMVEASIAISLLAGFVCFQLALIRPAKPDGIELTKQGEPALFAMLERRVSHFRAEVIDRVVLCTDAQLKIEATPRCLFPLFHTHSLCVGAPLLFFLSQGQFRLALAGAVGRNSGGRSRITVWVVQLSQDWSNIAKALEDQGSFSSRLLISPVRWVAHVTDWLGKELNADIQQAQGQWVLDHADEQAAADFLASQVVASAFLEKLYWPMIYKAAQRSASPVVHPFSHLPLLLTRLLDIDQPKRWLLQAQASNQVGQTALRDILASLNLDRLSWPGLPEKNAFTSVFQSPDLLKQLDKYWQQSIASDWKRRYKRFQQDRRRFERLQHEANAGTLHGDSAARYVKLAKRFMGKADLVTAYLVVYHSNLNNPGLCMLCGQELLAAGQSQDGYTALQRASDLQPALTGRAQALMRAHRESWLDEQQVIVKRTHGA